MRGTNSSDGALFKKSFKFGVAAPLVKSYNNIPWSSATYLLAFTVKNNQTKTQLPSC